MSRLAFFDLSVTGAVIIALIVLAMIAIKKLERKFQTANGEDPEDTEIVVPQRAALTRPLVSDAGPDDWLTPLSKEVAAEELAPPLPAPEPEPFAPARAPMPSTSGAIEAARLRPIVFREFMPSGPGQDGLSFWGGQPIAPLDFEWPTGYGKDGVEPLHFILQWDCAQLSKQDSTGLIPKDGALYFFSCLSWGKFGHSSEGFRFIHHPGPTDGWAPIDPPVNLGPAMGEHGAWQMSGCSEKVDNAVTHVPRLMPRFPFEPLAFDYPEPDMDSEDFYGLFWEEKDAAEAVLAAIKSGQPEQPIRDIDAPKPPFGRPFPEFPQDTAAVRVMMAKALKETHRPNVARWSRSYPDLSEEELKAQFATWHEQAKRAFEQACEQPLGARVDQAVSDEIWTWLEEHKFLFLGFHDLVLECVDLSLGVNGEALDTVPEALKVETMERNHVIASEYMRNQYSHEHPDRQKPNFKEIWAELEKSGNRKRVRSVHAPTPAHMFGPPSFVQGDVEEPMADHLLLLELPSGSGPEHHFGEGVLQYLIAPEDLAARRFNAVKMILTGY